MRDLTGQDEPMTPDELKAYFAEFSQLGKMEGVRQGWRAPGARKPPDQRF